MAEAGNADERVLMKLARKLTVAALVGATGLAVGCNFSGGGSSSKGTTTPRAQVGQVTSAFPAADRNVDGYDFAAMYEPTSVEGAAASELAWAGGDLIVADSPFSEMHRVDAQGTGTSEGALDFDANSIFDVGGTLYAPTSNRQAPGAGDLYSRSTGGLWTKAHDGTQSELAACGDAAGGIWIAEGTQGFGNAAEISYDDGVTGLTSIASVTSSIPTAAIEFNGELWLGCADSDDLGGEAKLWRGSVTTPFVEESLPTARVSSDVRQQINDMMVITVTIDPVAGTTRDYLVMSIGSYAMNGDQARAGEIVVTDGTLYEVVANYRGVAPEGILWADDTIYAALSDGRVQYRNNDGTWGNEDDLALLTTARSLTLNAAGDMIIGGGSATGVSIVHRTAKAGTTPPGNDLYYVDDVAPLLATSCASCHNGALPAATAVFAMANPRDDATDFAVVGTKIDTATPAASLLLLKAAGDSSVGGHGGGALWAVGSAQYTTILDWITQGAIYEAPTTPPPPPPPPPPSTYANVHSFLQADCSGCHSGGVGGYTVNANVDQSYNSAITKINAGTPENSLLLTKPNNMPVHGGGAIAGYSGAGQAKYDALLKWIADGAMR
jgi:hypothetical protein